MFRPYNFLAKKYLNIGPVWQFGINKIDWIYGKYLNWDSNRHLQFVKRMHLLLYHEIQLFQKWISNKSILNCVQMQLWSYIKIRYLFDLINFETQFLSSLQFSDGKLSIHRYVIVFNYKFITLKLFIRYNFYLLLLATKRVQLLTLCRVNYGFVNQNNCLFPLSSLYLCNLLFFLEGGYALYKM